MRLVFPSEPRPDIEAVAVFSESQVKAMKIRLLFGVGGASSAAGKPTFTAYNGQIRRVEATGNGAVLTIDATDPQPPGSSDVTVVEVHNGPESFAFSPADAEKGPMYVPDSHAYITLASDTRPFSPSLVKKGARIRERLAREPEQTYGKASREIPPLDPVERQGGRLYMPLATDASWQKFAFEWGGNIAISKSGTKAKARELARLSWPGDRISWRIGTGEEPTFRPRSADSTLSTLDDYLWVGMNPAEPLAFSGGLVTAGGGASVRAAVKLPAGAAAELVQTNDSGLPMPALHVSSSLGAGQETAAYLALPFIPGLTDTQRATLRRLDFDAERKRVLGYWREVTAASVLFEVPEPRFNSFARGLIARIRISATKDPRSGLYMVPAASYYYQVYANEAVFQCQLLDVTGYRNLAAKYLQTLVELQGSRSFAAEICCSRRRRRSAGSPPDRRSR